LFGHTAGKQAKDSAHFRIQFSGRNPVVQVDKLHLKQQICT
ncbi:hypothetical protein PAT3040_02556, partial [Paenibacillus agaridevorans]